MNCDSNLADLISEITSRFERFGIILTTPDHPEVVSYETLGEKLAFSVKIEPKKYDATAAQFEVSIEQQLPLNIPKEKREYYRPGKIFPAPPSHDEAPQGVTYSRKTEGHIAEAGTADKIEEAVVGTRYLIDFNKAQVSAEKIESIITLFVFRIYDHVKKYFANLEQKPK